MNKKNKTKKVYDPKTALAAADSFRRHSNSFIRKTGTNMKNAHKKAVNNLGELIASATMLALSLELYLKALRMILDLSIPHTHHLWSLYKTLPKEVKDSIETDYDNDKLNRDVCGYVDTFQIAIWVDGLGTNPPDRPDELDDLEQIDLKSVLVRSSDAFKTWRYMHEGGKVGQYAYYNYEFARLELICNVVRSHIIKLLNNE